MMMRIGAAKLRDFAQDTNGATVVEYCLTIALIALAIITAIGAVGDPSRNNLENLANRWPDQS